MLFSISDGGLRQGELSLVNGRQQSSAGALIIRDSGGLDFVLTPLTPH